MMWTQTLLLRLWDNDSGSCPHATPRHAVLHRPPPHPVLEIYPSTTTSTICVFSHITFFFFQDETSLICNPLLSLTLSNSCLASFLGAFANLRLATTSFVMSVCLSVRMEQTGSHSTDFNEIWYLSVFRYSTDRIQVSLKPDNYNRYFTWRPTYIYGNTSLNSSQNEKRFRQKL